jgi:hypothetical protein
VDARVVVDSVDMVSKLEAIFVCFVLVIVNAHRKFRKLTDIVIGFTREYSRVSYLSTGKQWLNKLIIHHHASTNLIYQVD